MHNLYLTLLFIICVGFRIAISWDLCRIDARLTTKWVVWRLTHLIFVMVLRCNGQFNVTFRQPVPLLIDHVETIYR